MRITSCLCSRLLSSFWFEDMFIGLWHPFHFVQSLGFLPRIHFTSQICSYSRTRPGSSRVLRGQRSPWVGHAQNEKEDGPSMLSHNAGAIKPPKQQGLIHRPSVRSILIALAALFAVITFNSICSHSVPSSGLIRSSACRTACHIFIRGSSPDVRRHRVGHPRLCIQTGMPACRFCQANIGRFT